MGHNFLGSAENKQKFLRNIVPLKRKIKYLRKMKLFFLQVSSHDRICGFMLVWERKCTPLFNFPLLDIFSKNKQQKKLNFFFSTFFMHEKNPQANLVSTYLPKWKTDLEMFEPIKKERLSLKKFPQFSSYEHRRRNNHFF